jgi:hypothetical protein
MQGRRLPTPCHIANRVASTAQHKGGQVEGLDIFNALAAEAHRAKRRQGGGQGGQQLFLWHPLHFGSPMRRNAQVEATQAVAAQGVCPALSSPHREHHIIMEGPPTPPTHVPCPAPRGCADLKDHGGGLVPRNHLLDDGLKHGQVACAGPRSTTHGAPCYGDRHCTPFPLPSPHLHRRSHPSRAH